VEHVFVGEIASGLRERHHLPARILELEESQLPAERIAGDVTAGAPRAFGELGELALKGAI
jgi:hypothetical protein